jgi:hypothetical protein
VSWSYEIIRRFGVDMSAPGEYVGLESEPSVTHVHCIGPTVIARFNTGSEAIMAYEAYHDTVIIHIGKNQSEVSKDQIEVMSENEYMGHMGEDINGEASNKEY